MYNSVALHRVCNPHHCPQEPPGPASRLPRPGSAGPLDAACRPALRLRLARCAPREALSRFAPVAAGGGGAPFLSLAETPHRKASPHSVSTRQFMAALLWAPVKNRATRMHVWALCGHALLIHKRVCRSGGANHTRATLCWTCKGTAGPFSTAVSSFTCPPAPCEGPPHPASTCHWASVLL